MGGRREEGRWALERGEGQGERERRPRQRGDLGRGTDRGLGQGKAGGKGIRKAFELVWRAKAGAGGERRWKLGEAEIWGTGWGGGRAGRGNLGREEWGMRRSGERGA